MNLTPDKMVDVSGEQLSLLTGEAGGIIVGLKELDEALGQGQPVYFCWDLKSLAALRSWGLPAAACISLHTDSALGGSAAEHIPELEGLEGCRAVIVVDGQVAWKNISKLLAEQLDEVGCDVKVVDIVGWWKEAPPAFMLTEYVAAHTVEKFLDSVAGTRGFRAPTNGNGKHHDEYESPGLPPSDTTVFGEQAVSQFKAKLWGEIGIGKIRYDWLVKDILPSRCVAMSFGASGAGKTFDTLDMDMSICRGVDFGGNKIKTPGLVIWVAGEKVAGAILRVAAYRKEHNLREDADLPFAMICRRPNLFQDEEETDKLIAEIKWIAKQYPSVPLVKVTIDTYSAVTGGLDENSSRDVSKMRMRFERMRDQLQCTIHLIHHTPKGGKGQDTPRGHSSLTNDFETTIFYVTEEMKERGLPVHKAVVRKQSEGRDGVSWKFVLPVRTVDYEDDGDSVTSCVKIEVLRDQVADKGEFQLRSPKQAQLFRALVLAVAEHGINAPADAQAPRGVLCVTRDRWRDQALRTYLTDQKDPALLEEAIRKSLQNNVPKFQNWGLIGIYTRAADAESYIWLTGKWPAGMGPKPSVVAAMDRDAGPAETLATGEEK